MLNNQKRTGLIVLVLIIIAIIAIVTSTVVLLANKDNNDSKNNDNELNVPVSNEESNKGNENVSQNNSSKNNKLVSTQKVPLQKIYIDVPNYNRIEEGYTTIYWNKGVSYITFTCMRDDDIIASTVSEAHKVTFDCFLRSVNDHHFVNKLGNVKEKNIIINGIDTYNYEGVICAGHNPIYDAYVYGYAFIYGGFPCAIIGVVSDESQPQSEIVNVKEIVDAMMLTVRNTK